MKSVGAIATVAAVAMVVAIAALGWRYRDALRAERPASQSNRAAVLGASGPGPATPTATGFPPPPTPRDATPVVASLGSGNALAVWTHGSRVVGARLAPEHGWVGMQVLEDIGGKAGEPQLAANGQGAAMAVWPHTLGNVSSLRYARFSIDSGWSAPDVVPGILPRPAGPKAPAKLEVDAEGNATLQWPSAFGTGSAQVARFETATGWSDPQDVALR